MKQHWGVIVGAALFLTPAHANDAQAGAYNAQKGGVSLVVMRDGAIVFEDYPNAGDAAKAWKLASGTKSFSGVIAAAAVQDGLLTLDEKAAETLHEWRDDPDKAEITIRQILSLTSGIDTPAPGRIPTYANAVALPMEAAPGLLFEYGPANFQIFGEIMRRKLMSFENGRHENVLNYLQARVFNPLGIAPTAWKLGHDRQPRLSSGAQLTARDWARFGQFVLQKGEWGGAQLVNAASLEENFMGSSANAAYGLTWWLNHRPSADALAASRTMRRASDLFTNPKAAKLPADLVMAAGAGGQRLYLIPSQQLVIVRQYPKFRERRFGQRRRGGPYSDVEFLLTVLAP